VIFFYCYCNTTRWIASQLDHYCCCSAISRCEDWTALCAVAFVIDSERQLRLAPQSTSPLDSQKSACLWCSLFHCCRQMVEHFINAALSKSWIEAQPLPPRLSVSVRGTEIDIKWATISLSLVCKRMPEVNKMALRI